MKDLFKSKILLVVLFSILLLSFLLRSHNIYTWPREGATFDEYAWTWLGISLIKEGVPESWSYHPQYENRKEIKYHKANFILVTPYLEHPPFFGLIAGSYAILNGANGILDVRLENIRGLALILGVLSTLLVFVIAKKLYGNGIAIMSAFLYAIVPTVVVGSRIVQNENFFIPMWLASLVFAISYLENKKVWMKYVAAILCGLLIISKIPWIAAGFSIFIIYIYKNKLKDAIELLLIIFGFLILFFAYGLYFDKDVFLNLWALQLNRYDITFSSIYALFQKPFLADRFLLDGWIFWGWISFIILLVKDFRKNFVLISAVLSYFLVFLAGIPDEPGHGWYRYPFYPFLIISMAIFLKDYFAKNWVMTFFFLVIVGTTLFELTWTPKFGFSYFIFRLAIIGWGITLIPQFLSQTRYQIGGKVVSYLWLLVFIIMSIRAVMIYNEM